ncbi:hypothetical protein M3J07_006164 [Ascochyta lentis]
MLAAQQDDSTCCRLKNQTLMCAIQAMALNVEVMYVEPHDSVVNIVLRPRFGNSTNLELCSR